MKPNWIIWHITNKCNLTCDYCFTSSGPKAEEPLSLEDLLLISDKINRCEVKLVTLIGGEPFALPHLPKLVEALYSENRQINLDTNGTYLRSRWHEIYEKINRINVSLDDIDKETHNTQRGSYSAVIDAIEFLRERAVFWSGNITITNLNYRNVLPTAEFLFEKGAKIIGFSRLKPIGKGRNVNGELYLSSNQENEVCEKIIEFYRQHSGNVKILVSGFYNPRLFEEGVVSDLPSCLCGVMRFTINHDGFVYPCEAMPFLYSREEVSREFGEPMSAVENDFERIMESDLMIRWRKVVYAKPQECKDCRYRLYCTSGCRALTYYKEKSLFKRDPVCKIG